MAENCAFRALARLMLIVRRQGHVTFSKGNKTMAKLETLTFTLSMMLSSLLVIATIAPGA
jgi:hypothetical protein